MAPHESDEDTRVENAIDHMPSVEKAQTIRDSNEGRLLLTEEEALAWARGNPKDDEPIYITWSHQDRENPRNWGLFRKYYVTTFASLLNTVSCSKHAFLDTADPVGHMYMCRLYLVCWRQSHSNIWFVC